MYRHERQAKERLQAVPQSSSPTFTQTTSSIEIMRKATKPKLPKTCKYHSNSELVRCNNTVIEANHVCQANLEIPIPSSIYKPLIDSETQSSWKHHINIISTNTSINISFIIIKTNINDIINTTKKSNKSPGTYVVNIAVSPAVAHKQVEPISIIEKTHAAQRQEKTKTRSNKEDSETNGPWNLTSASIQHRLEVFAHTHFRCLHTLFSIVDRERLSPLTSDACVSHWRSLAVIIRLHSCTDARIHCSHQG